MIWRRFLQILMVLLVLCMPVIAGAQQYRSKVLIDHGDTLEKGMALSIEQLETQLESVTDAYARSSTSRYLAQQYLQQGDYDKAINYYQTAIDSEGLSDIANCELLRELARVHLLKKDFSSAADTLVKVLEFNLVQEKMDFLMLAEAQFLSGDYVTCVDTLDRLQANGLTLDETDLRQVLALYYQSGAWSQSTAILKDLLVRLPDNPDYWHQLAAIYLQQNQTRKALDQLSLAYEKQIPFREHELLLLADLYAYNTQPFAAAHLLQVEMDRGRLPADGEHYRKLFEYWLLAREKEKAITALDSAARLTGDTELYLHLAQLQSDREDWQSMHATVLEACNTELEDRYVGRANLLLGISQLKLGDRDNARRSFINATLIGGATSQAAQWLEFMNAEPPSDDEIRKIVSPCYGSIDRRSRESKLAKAPPPKEPDTSSSSPEPKSENGADQEKTTTVATRTVPGMRLFTAKYTMTPTEMAQQLEGLATRLGMSLARAGGEIDGPLHLLVDTTHDRTGQKQELLLGFPARGNPRPSGRYRMVSKSGFNCAYMAYEGPVGGISEAWTRLTEATLKARHKLNGQARYVFACKGDCSEERMLVELQLGID